MAKLSTALPSGSICATQPLVRSGDDVHRLLAHGDAVEAAPSGPRPPRVRIPPPQGAECSAPHYGENVFRIVEGYRRIPRLQGDTLRRRKIRSHPESGVTE